MEELLTRVAYDPAETGIQILQDIRILALAVLFVLTVNTFYPIIRNLAVWK